MTDATSILEDLGGVVDDDPPNSVYVTLDLDGGYSLQLSSSWRKNYVHWEVFDDRDTAEHPRPLMRGTIARLDPAEDDPRFAITEENDHASIDRIDGPNDYRAIGRAFERLGYVFGDWLVRDG